MSPIGDNPAPAKPYLSILLPALVGAVAGGRWLGMAILVVSEGVGEALDFAALLVSGGVLVGLATIVYNCIGRTALVIFALAASLSALVGPVFV